MLSMVFSDCYAEWYYAECGIFLLLCWLPLCWVGQFLIVILDAIIMTGAFSYCYAECHYSECGSFLLLCWLPFCWVGHFLIVILTVIMLRAIMHSVAISYCYADCRYAEFQYAECHNAECFYAEYSATLNSQHLGLNVVVLTFAYFYIYAECSSVVMLF